MGSAAATSLAAKAAAIGTTTTSGGDAGARSSPAGNKFQYGSFGVAGGVGLHQQHRSPRLNDKTGRFVTSPPRRSGSIASSALSDDDSDAGQRGRGHHHDSHKTDNFETYIHLVKGYMGAGCLSLPWAVSQLGLTYGFLAIVTMSVWSSYNCWTVVALKRHIERTRPTIVEEENNNSLVNHSSHHANETTSEAGETSSVATSRSMATSVTYPDVGDWAYGSKFQHYVKICVCVQQLAICTVFVSFVGENLLALLRFLGIQSLLSTHVGVMTAATPFMMGLSFLPSLKSLAPVMILGTVLLGVTFFAVGMAIGDEWEFRPAQGPDVNPSVVPLALCAILYSYEGINLILPVESAMQKPQQFAPVFVGAMATVAFLLAGFATACVVAFGNVRAIWKESFLRIDGAAHSLCSSVRLTGNERVRHSVPDLRLPG